MDTCTYEAVISITEIFKQKEFIEKVCGKNYSYFNLVSWYFYIFNQNGFWILPLLSLMIPFFFLQIMAAAFHYSSCLTSLWWRLSLLIFTVANNLSLKLWWFMIFFDIFKLLWWQQTGSYFVGVRIMKEWLAASYSSERKKTLFIKW